MQAVFPAKLRVPLSPCFGMRIFISREAEYLCHSSGTNQEVNMDDCRMTRKYPHRKNWQRWILLLSPSKLRLLPQRKTSKISVLVNILLSHLVSHAIADIYLSPQYPYDVSSHR